MFEDVDDLLGTGNTYFALSANGTLVGWGSNDTGRLGIGIFSSYPYIARKTLAYNALAFSCGSTAVMYVDSSHVLWGWGTNDQLLLKDSTSSFHTKVKIMEDVADVAVGFNHAAVIKTDGSLWTWGQNTEGGLGNGSIDVDNGAILNDGQYYEPQKIMDRAKKVRIIDGFTFVITENDDLYLWGMWGVYSPTMVAQGVKDVAYLGDNIQYQYLTLDGEVFAITANSRENSYDLAQEPIATGVRSLCKGGLIKEDSSLWSWQAVGNARTLVKERDNICTAVDATHYVSATGRLYSDNGIGFLPTMSRSVHTMVPILRNIALLLLLVNLWLNRKKPGRNKLKLPTG
jgi:hypothetical protein